MILRFDGSGDITNRYLHGPAVDQILADEQVASTTTPGDVLWPLTDHLGSVRDIAEYDAVTGITSIANHIVYDSFGNRNSETNAAIDSLFGFTGREWDDAVDLQYNRARWYDPATGRWLSNDPIGFKAGDANLTRYVGNGPTILTDASGLWVMIPTFESPEDLSEYDPPPKGLPEYEAIPPSGPVTEPGSLDFEDWLEDLRDDLIVDPIKEETLGELKDWWENHPLNPVPPRNDAPCPPGELRQQPPPGTWDFNPDWHYPLPVDPVDPRGTWEWEFLFEITR